MGYRRAGFRKLVGVDLQPQPNYPFTFWQGDVMEAVLDTDWLDTFHVIHASPPCQLFTPLNNFRPDIERIDLVTPLRPHLQAWAERTGRAYVIENVPGSPLIDYIQLCGSTVGLPWVTCRDGKQRRVRRHRWFESNVPLMTQRCYHPMGEGTLGVYGTGGPNMDVLSRRGYQAYTDETGVGMGIDWMTREEIREAIPPAYTEFIGRQLLQHL